jgi:hypothetical protein
MWKAVIGSPTRSRHADIAEKSSVKQARGANALHFNSRHFLKRPVELFCLDSKDSGPAEKKSFASPEKFLLLFFLKLPAVFTAISVRNGRED